MNYIESPSTDAYFNMALEEYVFEHLPKTESWFMLWQNKNAVVVGKYQNTVGEINAEYVKEHNISVVRRLSGGGAMYHDLGNINFTYIVNQNTEKPLDFSVFITPVVSALQSLGVDAQASSRNDIIVSGKKISGNSQHNKNGRTMHHGTLLYSSNLDIIGNALKVKKDKIESKGIKSVRSRVANICDYLPAPLSTEDFKTLLLQNIFKENNDIQKYSLTSCDISAVKALSESKYAKWEWNYGRSPAYEIEKHRRFPFGGVDAAYSVKNGKIENISLSGDFFGNDDISILENILCGVRLQEDDILSALLSANLSNCISGITGEMLSELILY